MSLFPNHLRYLLMQLCIARQFPVLDILFDHPPANINFQHRGHPQEDVHQTDTNDVDMIFQWLWSSSPAWI